MAPKKKEIIKLSVNEFLSDFGGGGGASWADEVEENIGTQPLPPSERRGTTGYSSYGGSDNNRGYSSIRDNLPQKLPDKPPFTAHLGNLSYEATVESVTEFFTGCKLLNVRIIEDREQNRPKGFAYAEFEDLEGLKQALTLDSVSFQGRQIRIKVADPPKNRYDGAESNRDLSDWSRKGPLPDLGSSRPGRSNDFERRPPREFQSDDKPRDFTWERKGPLSPLPQAERPPPSRDGSRAPPMMERSESRRGMGNRRESPAWGPGEGRQDSRPPRREFADRPERPERAPTAADKEINWRNNMRPDAAQGQPAQSRDGSEAPSSPVVGAQQPAGRPKLNLAKRTVSEAPDILSPASSAEAKANPFGAARPIDTAAREREIEEKRIQAKKEADDKVLEERRLAKEAAEAKEAADKAAAEEAAKEAAETAQKLAAGAAAAQVHAEDVNSPTEDPITNGGPDQQRAPVRPREDREPRERREPRDQESLQANVQTRATESINWRQPFGDRPASSRGGIPSGPRRGGGPGRGQERGPRDPTRVPRPNGSAQVQETSADQAPPTPTVDEDGWTTVPNKGRRQSNRPLAS